jgi:serine/threonine-protein kinase RsbT
VNHAVSGGSLSDLGRPGRRADAGAANWPLPGRLAVSDQWDVVVARRLVRDLARQAGLSESSMHALETAISEIVQNIVTHAMRGDVSLDIVEDRGRRGVVVVARDDGPGIAEPSRAMQDGYSTTRSLGLGLSSARRLVDEFDLVSEVGRGTTVVLKKWQ